MSMQDPIADMLTRIRNAQMAKHKTLSMDSSKLKVGVVSVLKDEGFIADFDETTDGTKKKLHIHLKYYENKPVIDRIERISKPGLRIYKSVKELGNVRGFGVAILSTSKGVMSDKQAKAQLLGGEVLCEVA